MLRSFCRQPNPFRATWALGPMLACLLFAFPLAAGIAAAQALDSLPNAPLPQPPPAQLFAETVPSVSLLDPQHGGIGRNGSLDVLRLETSLLLEERRLVVGTRHCLHLWKLHCS